jgi:hypothetical protein
MTRRTYKLDHATKGTGASVVPIDEGPKARTGDDRLRTTPIPREPRAPRQEGTRFATPLPPGHVRKKSTGEIGKVKALDPKAGTVTVHWLKGGATSTVPLASVTRR